MPETSAVLTVAAEAVVNARLGYFAMMVTASRVVSLNVGARNAVAMAAAAPAGPVRQTSSALPMDTAMPSVSLTAPACSAATMDVAAVAAPALPIRPALTATVRQAACPTVRANSAVTMAVAVLVAAVHPISSAIYKATV